MLVAVDDVHFERPLVGDRLADVLNGVLDRGRIVDRHDIRGHQPTGRVLGILEEILNVLRMLFLHELEDLGGLLGGQLFDDIGGVLGRHPVKDGGDLNVFLRVE